MPEYQITLKVNFYSPDEEDSRTMGEYLAEYIFSIDDVNSIEAPMTPILVKEDD